MRTAGRLAFIRLCQIRDAVTISVNTICGHAAGTVGPQNCNKKYVKTHSL